MENISIPIIVPTGKHAGKLIRELSTNSLEWQLKHSRLDPKLRLALQGELEHRRILRQQVAALKELSR